jgi:signal transduction histidine kinase
MSISNDSYAQLLSLAVHEFRTPASVVGGYLRMLQHDADAPLSERQSHMVEEAAKSCARLVALVAEMSELAKIDADRAKWGDQPLDLFPLVQEVADDVHEGEDREVRLEVRGQAAEAAMSGDAARLRTAFQSLFKAILREQPAACTVVVDRRIERRAGGSSAVIVIAEASAVQDAYELPAAPFDEFDRNRGGLGLALPMARRVIERHGGRLSAPVAPAGAGADQIAARGVAIISLPLRS